MVDETRELSRWESREDLRQNFEYMVRLSRHRNALHTQDPSCGKARERLATMSHYS